jgi:hypothetical protein
VYVALGSLRMDRSFGGLELAPFYGKHLESSWGFQNEWLESRALPGPAKTLTLSDGRYVQTPLEGTTPSGLPTSRRALLARKAPKDLEAPLVS